MSVITDHVDKPVELYQYLRTLVGTAEASKSPYPKFALVEAYWHIGRIIVEIEQRGQERADYGIHLIELLSQQMTEQFGRGYSLPNMWRFKQFYLAFPILSKIRREFTGLKQILRQELCWSHYRQLMQLTDLVERDFYLNRAANEHWTVEFLQRMIRTRLYQKTELGETTLLPPTPPPTAEKPKREKKISTLSLVDRQVRTRLANVKKQLLERYVGYAFVAQRQYVSIAGEDHWAELVFFHYVLNRFVLVQLGEHEPARVQGFQKLVDGYVARLPPTADKMPVGFLINAAGTVQVLTTSHEPELTTEEALSLPQRLEQIG